MIASETPAHEDQPAMPKSNYRASGLVLRPQAAGEKSLQAFWRRTKWKSEQLQI